MLLGIKSNITCATCHPHVVACFMRAEHPPNMGIVPCRMMPSYILPQCFMRADRRPPHPFMHVVSCSMNLMGQCTFLRADTPPPPCMFIPCSTRPMSRHPHIMSWFMRADRRLCMLFVSCSMRPSGLSRPSSSSTRQQHRQAAAKQQQTARSSSRMVPCCMTWCLRRH